MLLSVEGVKRTSALSILVLIALDNFDKINAKDQIKTQPAKTARKIVRGPSTVSGYGKRDIIMDSM